MIGLGWLARGAGRWVGPVGAVLLLAGCGGGGGSTSTGTTPTAPTTPTTPTAPAPPPEPVLTIAGATVTPTALDSIATRSGTWTIADLGAVGDASVGARAYMWRLTGNTSFVRVMICRRLFTKEAGDATAVSTFSVPVRLTLGSAVSDWTLAVAQGSCRVMQNEEPVAPNPAWLREAVAAHVIPTYRRERTWLTAAPALLSTDANRGAYDPASLGPIPGSSATPTANNNYVGVTSAQGGEFSASRGFVHDIDARLVDAAVHNEDSRITAAWPQVVQYTYYSLAQPQGSQWSLTNHITADPQFAFTGDRPYEVQFGVAPRADIDSMQDVTNWGRDVAHLENTAYVHWLMTEDPIAGLAVQRQAAYALASFAENFRTGLATYRGTTLQERGMFNTISALWKSREVSRRVSSLNGRVFWSLARANQQATELIADYDAIRARVAVATPTSAGVNVAADYVNNLVGTPFNVQGPAPWDMADGSSQTFASTSNFMPAQYGVVPMWLWAKAGNATVRQWMIAYSRGFVVRLNTIGGTMGVDGLPDQRGSAIAIGPSAANSFGVQAPAPPPFSTDTGWGQWLVAQPFLATPSRTTFNAAGIHTATQMEGMLLFARDLALPVAELDTAISRVTAAKAASTQSTYRFTDIYSLKHMSGPD